MSPRFLAAGDEGIVVELGNAIEPELNAAVRALDRVLSADPFPGYREAIPSYRSLLVFYEPAILGFDDVAEHLSLCWERADREALPPTPVKEVPTVYDGADLEEVADLSGISPEDVVRLHSEREYLVYVVGFTPGFAYMGTTHPKLDLPRRASPRTRVPAGAVAIAMGQTGIYPSETPGGWHLLGRAEHRTLFDVEASPPSRFVPGDRVRFVPVASLPELPSVLEPSPQAVSRAAPVVEVEDGGLLTTVQDRGRFGYQRYGVPVAGAADREALDAANALVGNDPDAAALECTVHGPTLRFLDSRIVSLCGADLGAVVERADLGCWRPPPGSSFLMRRGNVLAFDGRRRGARAYLGIAGGFDVPKVLGSRSTYLTAGLGGFHGRALRAGDRLAAAPPSRWAPAGALAGESGRVDDDSRLRVIWGPQDDYFTKQARKTLEAASYTVGPSSDRMGCRLEGPALEHRAEREVVSDGNALGSIQVPPNGLPIVMLADRATTGGYPKIATVIAEDVRRLAQRLPGDVVRFESFSRARRHTRKK